MNIEAAHVQALAEFSSDATHGIFCEIFGHADGNVLWQKFFFSYEGDLLSLWASLSYPNKSRLLDYLNGRRR